MLKEKTETLADQFAALQAKFGQQKSISELILFLTKDFTCEDVTGGNLFFFSDGSVALTTSKGVPWIGMLHSSKDEQWLQ